MNVRAGVVGLLGLGVVAAVAGRPGRFDLSIQGWDLFHYTVGPRFFPEVGYWELYPTVLAVDAAGPDRFAHVTQVRELHGLEVVARATLAPAPLTEDRARELARWSGALEPLLAERSWRDVFRDRGYNGSPALTAVLRPIVAAIPPLSHGGRLALAAFDPVFLLAGLAAVAAAWRPRDAAAWLFLFGTFPGVWSRQGGGFFEYDWLAALLVGAAATATGRPVVAGVALGWAAATRLFPGIAALAVLAPALRRPTARDARFLAAFVGTLAACAALGCLAGRGPGAWLEFAERITVHAAAHPTGEQRVGLAHLLTFDGDPGRSTDALRAATLDDRRLLRWGLALGLAALAAVTALRRPRAEALFHGLVVGFALSVTSRYYAAAFLLWPLVAARQTWMAPAFLTLPLVAAALSSAGSYASWLGIEAGLGAIAVGRLLEVGARDTRVWRRWARRRVARPGTG